MDECVHRTWRVAVADEDLARSLSRDTGLSLLTARVLVSRGLTDADAAHAFLSPDLTTQWADPAVVPGMSDVSRRVAEAVSRRERIVVFGDFDLDGISSAALTTLGLRAMGAEVAAVVPHRFREGYGLTSASVERLLADPPQLVVTVDCGISAGPEVAELQRAGVAVVVTDHHEPGACMPGEVPIANPKLPGGDIRASTELAGAGVALKLVQAVGGLLGSDGGWRSLTDLAALGTIGDIVPLVGENRALVAHGLAVSRSCPRVSLRALCDVAGVDTGSLGTDQVAYALAPRLNAAGRMSDPELALSLLLETEEGRAAALARTLDEHNRLRQTIEQELQLAAAAQAERVFRPGDRALILAGEGWHEGVKGIVASRLASSFGIPVLLFCVEDGVAHGSGRTAGSVDLFRAVSACAPLLTRFGGHSAAVGITLQEADLPRFRECLAAHLGLLPDSAFRLETEIDAEVALEDLSVELVAELERLEPFGYANRRPLLAANGVFMSERRRVGRDGGHLRFSAFDGTAAVPAIAFRCREIERMNDEERAVDLAFEVKADEWRGKRRVQMIVRDHRTPGPAADAASADLVEDLFARADEVLAGGEYAGIDAAEAFHTKLVGVTFEGRQALVARLAQGTPLRLERQPENVHDGNACALFDPFGDQVGFLNRRLAGAVAPAIDSGVAYDVEVVEVTGREAGRDGTDDGTREPVIVHEASAGPRSLGVNVIVRRRLIPDGQEDAYAGAERRAELAALSPSKVEAEILGTLIPGRALHEAQRAALAHLDAGRSCLAIMATGRGKSLVFHAHAARLAVSRDIASVFVYPLRALVADQRSRLEDTLGSLGVGCWTLTGESPPRDRDDAFAAMCAGSVDVVLTTPEFLERHAARFAKCGRLGFVCVDEAHHVSASASHRPAYGRLGTVLEDLGRPTVFAATATAGDDVFGAIRETLGVGDVVVDDTVRENLRLVDRRGVFGGRAQKDAYVASLASRGSKVLVYVNSREQSVHIARGLRRRVPRMGHAVAYYHGGLSRPARHAIEHALGRGDITAVVATSAFGEGVDIPDVREVVLYHMPFSDVEYNQMCGRAGRDGMPATIHVAFGEKDARLNELVLGSSAPGEDDLRQLYRVLRAEQAEADGPFEITNAELADSVRRRRATSRLNERGVSAGIGVFRELGLVTDEGLGGYRRLALASETGKVELAASVRFMEGRREMEDYRAFRDWVLNAPADELLTRFNRPILPTRVE